MTYTNNHNLHIVLAISREEGNILQIVCIQPGFEAIKYDKHFVLLAIFNLRKKGKIALPVPL